MKATIINYDMIGSIADPDGIEIGSLPKGVGFERVRWDGANLIDLNILSQIWVQFIGGAFVLHCIEVPNSQLVTMNYSDRKKLWNNAGTYEIKTAEQEKIETNLKYRRAHYPTLSDQIGAIMKYLTTIPNIPTELQDLIDEIDAVKTKYNTTVRAG